MISLRCCDLGITVLYQIGKWTDTHIVSRLIVWIKILKYYQAIFLLIIIAYFCWMFILWQLWYLFAKNSFDRTRSTHYPILSEVRSVQVPLILILHTYWIQSDPENLTILSFIPSKKSSHSWPLYGLQAPTS